MPVLRATLPAWTEIARAFDAADAAPAEVYAITLDRPDVTAAYVSDHELAIRWVSFPDRRTRHLYRAGRVPLTLVVDEYGEVHHARVGLIDGRPAIDSVLEAARARPDAPLPAWPPARSGPGPTP